jgi:hypothetical protein
MSVSVYRKTDQTKLVVVRPAASISDGTGPTGNQGPTGDLGTSGIQGIQGTVGSVTNYYQTFVTSGNWDAPQSNPVTIGFSSVDVDFPSSRIRPWIQGS